MNSVRSPKQKTRARAHIYHVIVKLHQLITGTQFV